MQSSRSLPPLALIGVMLICGAGCSLITLKSPEKPLSTRDLNTRILTREYSAQFMAEVGRTADAIAAAADDPDIRLHALRWKIAAVGKSERAAGQMAPLMSLLDSWALAVQMDDFLTAGAGRMLFGAQQAPADALAADLAAKARDLARRLLPPEEFTQDERFIAGYAAAHPIADLHFARASIVDAWTHANGTQTKLVDTLGTVPEALADAGDRLRMYGETGPDQILWQAELAAQQSGIRAEDFRAALKRLDDRMAQMTAMVDTAPRLFNGMIRDAGTHFDASWADMMRDVRAEEIEVSKTVSTERAAAMDQLDLERTAVAADAARIANDVVREAGAEVRRLVREALALLIVLALVVLGLPFGAGYFVGRARRGR
jgi:hypothetical protein